MLFDYVNKMKLEAKVNPPFYKDLARKHLEKSKYHEAALIIHKFKFKTEFDCIMIIEKLAISSRIPAAKQLCELDESYKLHLIKFLAASENFKDAGALIKEYKIDINEFPDLKERLEQQSMRNSLSRFYKDDVSIDRIEDLLYGIKPMLS